MKYYEDNDKLNSIIKRKDEELLELHSQAKLVESQKKLVLARQEYNKPAKKISINLDNNSGDAHRKLIET